MIRSVLTIGLLGTLMLTLPQSVSAQTQATGNTAATVRMTPTSPETIRQMPLLERPDRPGHFYGNTVRRINRRRAGR